MGILLKEVFVGLPRTVGVKGAVDPMDREWESGIFKQLVKGPVWLSKTGLAGDGQADLENHGGFEKAVLAYPFEHYAYWQKNLGMLQVVPGGMGENFLMENLTEDMIAVGDIFEIGEAVVQVSQPRQPCWKPARRFRVKDFALLTQNTGRTGWYFRVLKEGFVEGGQMFSLVERPLPHWTVSKCNEVMHGVTPNIEDVRKLAQCELLSQSWRNTFQKRLEKAENTSVQKRVIGPNE